MYKILRRIFTDCDIIDMYGLYCEFTNKTLYMTTNRLYYTTSKIYVQAGTTFKNKKEQQKAENKKRVMLAVLDA